MALVGCADLPFIQAIHDDDRVGARPFLLLDLPTILARRCVALTRDQAALGNTESMAAQAAVNLGFVSDSRSCAVLLVCLGRCAPDALHFLPLAD